MLTQRSAAPGFIRSRRVRLLVSRGGRIVVDYHVYDEFHAHVVRTTPHRLSARILTRPKGSPKPSMRRRRWISSPVLLNRRKRIMTLSGLIPKAWM